MKKLIAISFFLFSTSLLAQYSLRIEAYNPKELVQMSGLIARFGGQNDRVLDSLIETDQFSTVYSSPVKGLDHKFQVHQKKHHWVINFRGSQPKVESWMANAYASMIPAKGQVRIDGKKWNYNFSDDPEAAVHSGYVLAIGFLLGELKSQIKEAQSEGLKKLNIIGHSQGGGIAGLFFCWVMQNKQELGLEQVDIMSFTFGAPMIGNQAFYDWHKKKYGDKNLSFQVANEEDPVPDLPLEYNDQNYIEKHIKDALINPKSIQWTSLTKDVLSNYFEKEIKEVVHEIGFSIEDQIAQYDVPIEVPEPVQSVNYKKLSGRILLSSYPVPESQKREPSGSWMDHWMPEGPLFYQHYSGTYYKACFKKYFPELFTQFNEK